MKYLSKKGASIGTRILVTIVVIVAASITLINLLTIFGVIKSPDLLTYGIIVGIYLLPFLIIAGTLNKIIVEEKESIQKRIEEPSEFGKKVRLKIDLTRGEKIKLKASSHPAFYVKIAIASALSVILGASSLLILPEVLTDGNIGNFLPVFIPVLTLCVVIHIFSKNIFSPGGWGEFVEHTWIALMVIAICLSLLISLKSYIISRYPRQFWETFLGMPFSLFTLMFLIMMLLVGGILIRLGELFNLEGGPFKASGVTVVLVSLTFMVPQLELIGWDILLKVISQVFSLALIFYGLVTGVLLYNVAGIKYIVTNKRVIKFNTHRFERSVYYLLSSMKKIGVVQDIIAETFGYGNIVMQFHKRSRSIYGIFYGVEDPYSIAKQIKKATYHKKQKKRSPKKKQKKRPIKKKRKKLMPKKNSGDSFYYKLMIPIIVGLILFSTLVIPTASGTEPTQHVKSDYQITYHGFASLSINGTYEIYSYEMDGYILSAEDIRTSYDEEIEGKLKDTVLGLVDTLIERSYRITDERGDVNTSIEICQESLNLSVSPEEPIILTSNSIIELNTEFFDLPKQADIEEIIFGALKVGGELTNELELICEAGHEASYKFLVPEELIILGDDSYHIDNTDNMDAVNQTIDFRLAHQEPVEITETDTEFSITVDVHELRREDDGEYICIEFDLSASFQEMRIPNVLQEQIPDQLDLEYINAALIRLFYENGFEYPIHDFTSDLNNEIDLLVYDMGEVIFRSKLTVLNLDEGYDLDTMDSYPSIIMYYNASIERKLSDDRVDTTAFIPRTYSISDNVELYILNPTEWDMDIKVMLPEGMDLLRARFRGQRLDIKGDRRSYVEYDLPSGEDGVLSMDIGTEIDITEFIPFMVIIGVLFVVWIGLNLYRPKRRR